MHAGSYRDHRCRHHILRVSKKILFSIGSRLELTYLRVLAILNALHLAFTLAAVSARDLNCCASPQINRCQFTMGDTLSGISFVTEFSEPYVPRSS